MLKRTLRNRWSGWQLAAGLCIAASILLLVVALLQKDSSAQPHWTAVNAQVDSALASLEHGTAGEQEEQAPSVEKEKNAPEAGPQTDTAQASAVGMKEANTGSKPSGETTIDKESDENGQNGAVKEAEGQSETVKEAKGQGDTAKEVKGEVSSNSPDSTATNSDKETASSSADNGKIDINHASAAELDALPGIGAAKADAIVADREQNGLFHSIDDLLRVKGIGPKLLENMKSFIVLQP